MTKHTERLSQSQRDELEAAKDGSWAQGRERVDAVLAFDLTGSPLPCEGQSVRPVRSMDTYFKWMRLYRLGGVEALLRPPGARWSPLTEGQRSELEAAKDHPERFPILPGRLYERVNAILEMDRSGSPLPDPADVRHKTETYTIWIQLYLAGGINALLRIPGRTSALTPAQLEHVAEAFRVFKETAVGEGQKTIGKEWKKYAMGRRSTKARRALEQLFGVGADVVRVAWLRCVRRTPARF